MSEHETAAKQIFFSHFPVSLGDPDRELLKQVVLHFSKLPYENLTKIISKFTFDDPDERLRGPEEVLRGFIENHTGGTCFSLTWCLGSILSGAGYRCYPVMADMKRANIHCALVVHVGERRFIVDPGYLLGEPVELDDKPAVVATTFGTVELRPRGGASYDLFTVAGTERKWRYRVRTSPVTSGQFLKHWKESFALPMMNSLQLTKLTDDGHLYIKNHHMRVTRLDGKTNENIRQGLESRIEREFGIPSAIVAEAHEYIERMKSEWRIRKPEPRGKALL